MPEIIPFLGFEELFYRKGDGMLHFDFRKTRTRLGIKALMSNECPYIIICLRGKYSGYYIRINNSLKREEKAQAIRDSSPILINSSFDPGAQG